jgi:tetratricopeptide (TPR) repeat protein
VRLAILLSFIAALAGQTLTPDAQVSRAQELHASGDFATATEILSNLIQNVDDAKDPPPWLARAYTNLGVISHDQGRFQEAERWHLKARRIAIPNSTVQLQVLNNLASAYLETAQYGKAERIIDEMSKLDIPPGELAIRTEGAIASLHMARGKNDKAEQMFIRLLAEWEKENKPRDAAVVLNNLGVLALERNDVRTAVSRLRRSYELWQREIGGDHVMFVHTIANYGAALLANRQAAAAEEHLSRALSLAEKWHGPEGRITLQVAAIYAEALKANGRKKEAKSMSDKVARGSSAFRPHTVDVLDLTQEKGKGR